MLLYMIDTLLFYSDFQHKVKMVPTRLITSDLYSWEFIQDEETFWLYVVLVTV